jgi:N4-gp56 family major capsid protein
MPDVSTTFGTAGHKSGQLTAGNIDQRTNTYAEAQMLAHAEPIVVLCKYGMAKPIPKKRSDNITFRRAMPYAVDTAALTLSEGVKPDARAMRYEDVNVSLTQYGGLFKLSDKVEDLHEDNVISDMSQLCGEEAAELMELVCWGAVRLTPHTSLLGTLIWKATFGI